MFIVSSMLKGKCFSLNTALQVSHNRLQKKKQKQTCTLMQVHSLQTYNQYCQVIEHCKAVVDLGVAGVKLINC